jgi:hypothetical protein
LEEIETGFISNACSNLKSMFEIRRYKRCYRCAEGENAKCGEKYADKTSC